MIDPGAPPTRDAPSNGNGNGDGALRGTGAIQFPERVVPESPPSELRYRRALELGRALSALWRARLTVWALVVRQGRAGL